MTIGCNATSGGFWATDVPAGLYLLRVSAGTGSYHGKRDFLAPVNAGEITYLGALVVVNQMLVNPGRPDVPGPDATRGIAPNSANPMRIPPEVWRGQPVK